MNGNGDMIDGEDQNGDEDDHGDGVTDEEDDEDVNESGLGGEWPEPQPTPVEITSALEAGQAGLRDRDFQEETTPTLAVDTPSNRHQTSMGTSSAASRHARAGYIMGIATRELFKGNKSLVPPGRGPRMNAAWLPEEMCGHVPDFGDICTPSPYRRANGTCNNPLHPTSWGVALRPFRRMVASDYADGVSDPRGGFYSKRLPTAREVSILVHRPVYVDDPKFTVMLAVWGQFLDHDITATALSKGANGSTISCCLDGQPRDSMHPECFPVILDDNDPYYSLYNMTCMEFVRSAPAAVCSLGPREQMNQATSYIDGSVVYGSDDKLMNRLRSFQGGRLRMEMSPDGRELLPFDNDPNDGCNQAELARKGKYCFLCGDKRANENLHLTTMHLLLARNHNNLAAKMAAVNPSWDDERLFQEARRMLGAQMQHITYNEFLPVLIGTRFMKHNNMLPLTSGYRNSYRPTVDPTVANEFAASAFRFAHTLLPTLFRRVANDSSSEESVELHKMLFDPFELYNPDRMDDTLRGGMQTNTRKVDPFFTTEVTQHLFEGPPPADKKKKRLPGLDLVTLNIQRGRDHGLEGYTAWRRLCGFSVPKDFSDLNGVMDKDSIARFMSIYRSVDDIDMYSGILSEVPVPGGALGPTVMCLLTDQFYRTMHGDRHWYETPEQPQAFTPEQLQEIRKTSLAGIICDNSDSIKSAQPWVMRLSVERNRPVPCEGDVIQHPDLAMWEEKDGHFVRPWSARGNGRSSQWRRHDGPHGWHREGGNGTMHGWHREGGNGSMHGWHGEGGNGTMHGWHREGGNGSMHGWHGEGGNGTMHGWHREGGNGTMHGWHREGGNGIMHGWHREGGNGTMHGWHREGGNGSMHGWHREAGNGTMHGWHREAGNGTMHGWHREGGNGTMHGWHREGGNGTMHGWHREGGNGTMHGWHREGGNGTMHGWHREGGNGTMHGWDREGGNGTMHGWHREGGNGTMHWHHNDAVTGSTQGKWWSRWSHNDGKWWTHWRQINGIWELHGRPYRRNKMAHRRQNNGKYMSHQQSNGNEEAHHQKNSGNWVTNKRKGDGKWTSQGRKHESHATTNTG